MKCILGAGIAGLIWAYYNKDYSIIASEVGGQMSSTFDLGPRYLHSTENVKKLLNELNIPIKEKTITVAYLDEAGNLKTECDEEFRKRYFLKSRGTTDLKGFDPSVMNSNKNILTVIDVNFKELVKILEEKIKSRIIQDSIVKIDLKEKIIKTKKADFFYKYNYLVSTIPLKTFSKLSDFEMNLESYSMTYCLYDNSFYPFSRHFDIIYIVETPFKFHRITKVEQGYVADFFGKEENLKNKYPYSMNYKDSKVLEHSQIISIKDTPRFEGVTFAGRYGTWNRDWKTERVIDEAIAYSKSI